MALGFPERLREHQLAAELAKMRKEAWEDGARQAHRRGHTPPPPADAEALPEPLAPRLRVDDVTVEKVADLLARAAPKGLLMVRDELAGWLLSYGRNWVMGE